ncbi:signal peptidase I [Chloroflexota bacterium]
MRLLVKWLTNMIVGLLVLSVFAFILLPAAFHSRLAVVYSGSMEPLMPTGAVAWMEPVDPERIKVGDIIAFNPHWDPEATVSHRVIELVSTPTLGFRTKGDANEDPDPDIISADSVLARVSFNMPELGYFLNRVSKYTTRRYGFALFIALPTILLIGGAVIDMNTMLSPGKQRKRKLKERRERRNKKKASWSTFARLWC